MNNKRFCIECNTPLNNGNCLMSENWSECCSCLGIHVRRNLKDISYNSQTRAYLTSDYKNKVEHHFNVKACDFLRTDENYAHESDLEFCKRSKHYSYGLPSAVIETKRNEQRKR